MTDRELLKEAKDLIVQCSLLDKSGKCEQMIAKIDKQLNVVNAAGRFYSEEEIKEIKETEYKRGLYFEGW